MKKRILSGLFALLTACLMTAAAFADATPTASPTTPPNAAGMPYMLDDYDEAPVVLSEWKGTPVYLNFFTTWCGYCKAEMPDLQALQAKYGENLRVVLVHIPSGEDEQTARDYLASAGLADMYFVEDNGFFQYMYGINSFPVSVVIDAEGYLSAYQPYAISADAMEQLVQQAGATVPQEVPDAA